MQCKEQTDCSGEVRDVVDDNTAFQNYTDAVWLLRITSYRHKLSATIAVIIIDLHQITADIIKIQEIFIKEQSIHTKSFKYFILSAHKRPKIHNKTTGLCQLVFLWHPSNVVSRTHQEMRYRTWTFTQCTPEATGIHWNNENNGHYAIQGHRFWYQSKAHIRFPISA